jgi:hypothetical protein
LFTHRAPSCSRGLREILAALLAVGRRVGGLLFAAEKSGGAAGRVVVTVTTSYPMDEILG